MDIQTSAHDLHSVKECYVSLCTPLICTLLFSSAVSYTYTRYTEVKLVQERRGPLLTLLKNEGEFINKMHNEY